MLYVFQLYVAIDLILDVTNAETTPIRRYLKNPFRHLVVSGVTVLLALVVFNEMVNEILPRVSTAVPIIGIPDNAGHISDIVIYDTYHMCPYIIYQASVLYILSFKRSIFHFLFSRNAHRKGCPFDDKRWI